MNKLRLIWMLLGPEELVALAAFLATLALWAATLSLLFG
jgi:hypothetical protein